MFEYLQKLCPNVQITNDYVCLESETRLGNLRNLLINIFKKTNANNVANFSTTTD